MMFQKLNVPVLGIVENMSTFVCPHCGQPTDLFGHGGAQAAAARYVCRSWVRSPSTSAFARVATAAVP